jgi:hypothetical protein
MKGNPESASGRVSAKALLAGSAVAVVGVAVIAGVVVLGQDGRDEPVEDSKRRACGASAPLVIETVQVGDWTPGLARVKPHGEPQVLTGDWVTSSPAFSPDGKRLAFERVYGDYESAGPGPSELWVMDADGSNPRLLAPEGVRPVWSPDGATIAFLGSDRTAAVSW